MTKESKCELCNDTGLEGGGNMFNDPCECQDVNKGFGRWVVGKFKGGQS